MALKPTTSGLLLKNIYFIVSDDDFKIELPDEKGESFDVLSKDIHDALAKEEPVLVLDRLHTYSSKYLREICLKHGIGTKDSSGKYYPLHSLAGMISKYYAESIVERFAHKTTWIETGDVNMRQYISWLIVVETDQQRPSKRSTGSSR